MRIQTFAAVSSLMSLAACQTPNSVANQAAEAVHVAPAIDRGGLAAVPACPSGVTAVLSSGAAVHFKGPTEDDAAVCVQTSNGKNYRYYLNFWGDGRFRHGTPDQRHALRSVVEGPVGTEVKFDLPRRSHLALWKSASVTHVANAHLVVGGRTRPTVKLRIVKHDSLGRADVTAESLYWIDGLTGIPLKKQVVTRMADGDVERTTTWRVVALHPTAS